MPESDFSFTVVRVAVTQVCQSMGFKSAQNLALETLTDLAIRYMKEIAKLAAASANSDGRTESNLPDVVVALEDLSSVQGFPGSWSIRCLYSSAVVKDLMRLVKYTDEIPFARPLPPRRRICSKAKFLKCFEYRDDDRWKHVPRWLPEVPVVVGKEKEVETKKEVKWEDHGWKEDHEKKKRLLSRARMALNLISDVYMPNMDGFKLLELVGLEMDLPFISVTMELAIIWSNPFGLRSLGTYGNM